MKLFKQLFLKNKNRRNCIFGRNTILSKDSFFAGKNYLGNSVQFKHSKIGFQSYIGDYSEIDNTVIGNFSCISHRVCVVQGQHPTSKYVSIHPSFYSKGFRNSYVDEDFFDNYKYLDKQNKVACYIGNDVWIGCNVLIMAGITIGDGSIIAAGSVVTKDVEPYTIVGGVPAKIIKKRFSDSEIKSLLELKWWDKDEQWILDHACDFNNISVFLEKNGK